MSCLSGPMAAVACFVHVYAVYLAIGLAAWLLIGLAVAIWLWWP